MSTNQRKSSGKMQCGGNEQKKNYEWNKMKWKHEMFKDFEKSIADVIAANNRITNYHIEKLTKHISDLQYSLEILQEETKNNMTKL